MRTFPSHADKLPTPIKEVAITNKFVLINMYTVTSRIPLNCEFTTFAMDFVVYNVRHRILKELLERNVLTVRKVTARKTKGYMLSFRRQKIKYFAMSQCFNKRSLEMLSILRCYRTEENILILFQIIDKWMVVYLGYGAYKVIQGFYVVFYEVLEVFRIKLHLPNFVNKQQVIGMIFKKRLYKIFKRLKIDIIAPDRVISGSFYARKGRGIARFIAQVKAHPLAILSDLWRSQTMLRVDSGNKVRQHGRFTALWQTGQKNLHVFIVTAREKNGMIKLFRSKKVYSSICRLSIISWQGLMSGNITFADELDFDVSDLNFIFDEISSDDH